MAALVHEHLLQKGVKLYLEQAVESFEETASGVTVKFKSGITIETDLVILSIGVRAETSLASAAGLELGEMKGIRVNEYLQTSDESVYAVGDAIEFPHPLTGKPWLNFLAGPANRQARIVADNMVFGNKVKYEGAVGTAIAKVFDQTVASTGLPAKRLIQFGIPYLSATIHSGSHAGYYPGALQMAIKITFSPLGIQEQHLNHALLGWAYNSTTKLWDFNNNYKLPDTNGASTGNDRPGYEYVGGWKLSSSDRVLNENEKLEAKDNPSDRATVSGEYKLANPTISYLVDGKTEDVDADQPFTVTIGDGKEHSIGIQVDHPLLKENQGTDEDYVYFEYYWFDEVSLGDGKNTLNGPRSMEELERFSTATSNVEIQYVDGEHNTIPIAKTEHARYEGSSYEGYNDYYLVVVFGYHVVNGKKADTPFYLSANNGIGVGNANATHGPHLLQVKVDEVRVITATADEHGKIDPAAGTVTVPKGESKTFTITPDSGYRIKDVLVDGVSVGAVSTYTFEDVVENHTIHATFARKHTPTPSTPTVEIPDDDALGLNTDDHFAYIIGYPDGSVQPNGQITRAEATTIFFRLLTEESRSANLTKTNRYSDVAATSWYNTAVSTLSSMGIITGYPDGTFRPNAAITRAEFAAIAARFDNDGDKTAAKFSDIANHWAKDEISIAYNNGWITGYPDGTFGPQRDITRAETMTLVNRVLNRQPETADDLLPNMTVWTDNANPKAWYYLAVQEATNSHYYKFKTNSQYEKWTELRETRDWTQLEK